MIFKKINNLCLKIDIFYGKICSLLRFRVPSGVWSRPQFQVGSGITKIIPGTLWYPGKCSNIHFLVIKFFDVDFTKYDTGIDDQLFFDEIFHRIFIQNVLQNLFRSPLSSQNINTLDYFPAIFTKYFIRNGFLFHVDFRG